MDYRWQVYVHFMNNLWPNVTLLCEDRKNSMSSVQTSDMLNTFCAWMLAADEGSVLCWEKFPQISWFILFLYSFKNWLVLAIKTDLWSLRFYSLCFMGKYKDLFWHWNFEVKICTAVVKNWSFNMQYSNHLFLQNFNKNKETNFIRYFVTLSSFPMEYTSFNWNLYCI